MRPFTQAATILRKDLLTELRSGELFASMLLFALLLVLLFSFSFTRGEDSSPESAAGILWISMTFAGTLGLSRAFDREREADGLRAMLLSPASRGAILIAKAVGILVFMLITAILIVPLVALLFQVPLVDSIARLGILLFLGMLGFSLLGAFFGALMAKGRSRDLLFLICLYPLSFPLLIAGVLGTAELFSGEPVRARVELFTSILVAFDALIAVAALWMFERLVVE